ncbi:uncharacterized protein LOC114542471 [Dendronephthya gigantea]|uniref:uncharacterized protein LOC114542471 n=1 Tax=Dendronephthya gigantea TaxID=151771 RepID=UPI00106CA7BA|nr:uncharacterized protein LOC114542471 [Dendronephthya gigantea]
MKFAKLVIILVALSATFVFIFNYKMLDIILRMKGNIAFRSSINLRLSIVEKDDSEDIVKEPSSSNEQVQPIHSDYPTYHTFEAMLHDDTHESNNRAFPAYSSCPYRGIRKPRETSDSKTLVPECRRRKSTSRDCEDVIKYFGPHGTMTPGKCDIEDAVKICSISGGENYKREQVQVSCNDSHCRGKTILLGLFNEKMGKVTWRKLNDTDDLNAQLKQHILSSTFGPGFALLKCGKGTQVLSFPTILKRVKPSRRLKKRRPFNINVVVEDSLSRAHFYRTLLKTASTFRDIVYNQTIPSTLLEFEKVQGYETNTYKNLQRLFAGRKYLHVKKNCKYTLEEFKANGSTFNCTHGIEEMFARYKNAGYSTLLQEDNCWYDSWGSFMDPRENIGPVRSKMERLSRWKDFVQLVQLSGRGKVVDDYGMSILTCDVYRKFKVTNPYNSKTVPNVCFAGRHYASFFLEYVKKYTELNDMADQPFIAYTHVLTSHDTNGRRIVNDDESLSELFRHAAHLRNTLTIFASDHGGKVINFAAYSTQGREEVFQPLLFMIIPHEVSKLLGSEAMNALVLNQNRLVGVEDLYNSLVSIIEPRVKKQTENAASNPEHSNQDTAGSNPKHLAAFADPISKTFREEEGLDGPLIKSRLQGLFRPVFLNRTCKEMKISSVALCLCDGMENTISNDTGTVRWAAEFVLGTLNNRIQEQYTTTLKTQLGKMATSKFFGYGACQRYVITGVTNARQVVVGINQKLLFTLLAKPIDRKTAEIFDVELTFPMKIGEHGIILNNLVRVSRFNEYEMCSDTGVDPKLCACHPYKTNNTLWRRKLFSMVTSQATLGMKPQTQFLDKPCLVIIARVKTIQIRPGRWQNATETYEAINRCKNVKYKLRISFRRAIKTRISLKYPAIVTLLPKTVTFLYTAINNWRFGKAVPKFSFKKTVLYRSNTTDKKL